MEIDDRPDIRPAFTTTGLGLCIPPSVVLEVLRYLDARSLRCLKLCNRAWNSTVSLLRPESVSSFPFLPNEIIHHICGYLNAVDFDNARHTCHAWMSASFDTVLLGL